MYTQVSYREAYSMYLMRLNKSVDAYSFPRLQHHMLYILFFELFVYRSIG